MIPVALITCAGRGIGRGIAIEVAAAGYAVAANYRKDAGAAAELQKMIRERGGICELVSGDVGVAEDRKALLAFCRERFGRLDLLVNNAGMAPEKRVDLLETTEESFDRQMQVNLKG